MEKKNAVDLSELSNQLFAIISAVEDKRTSEAKLDKVLQSICEHMKGDNWKVLADKFKKSSGDNHSLQIIPTKSELLTPETCLVPNILHGKFPSIAEYKDLHLRLLKEDFVATIRDNIEAVNVKDLDDDESRRVENVRIHRNIYLKRGPLNKQFPMNQSIYIDLKESDLAAGSNKRFMMGSLLVFTTSTKTLDNLTLALVQRQTEDMEEGVVPLEIVHAETARLFEHKFTMLEFEIFFEPYHHVFNALISSEVPFSDYIVFVKPDARLPKYVDRLANPTYSHRGSFFNVTDTLNKPPKIKGLNSSQQEAYYSALQKEFSLIQGPPGTGKTFLGLEILKTLLKNTEEKILIVCYTNHALDQVLTGLLQVTRDFVRLGSQSKNLQLDEFNIKEMKNEEDTDRTLQGLFYKARIEHSRLSKLYIDLQKSEEDVDEALILQTHKKLLSVSRQIDELHQLRQYRLIKDRRVVGMTTTFAARSHGLLELLNIPIVLIEEAGEILEAHIVATLTRNTEQVILIGDHFQLRPTTSVYRLAREYKLDISLFERMVNNKIGCVQLKEQHRMRPEIANLIKGTIYPELHDSLEVTEYPNVLGMSSNLFFLNHTNPESTKTDETTKTNQFEAEFMIQLAKFLLASGHQPRQITILTPYLGQFSLIRGLVQKSRLNGVHVAVIDNFQGEENDIILLSLVRSNKSNNIGYLRMSNRICVALSRAKIGLYIVGNMTCLAKSSPIWREIEGKLKATGCIGDTLNVTVNGSPFTITNPADIEALLT